MSPDDHDDQEELTIGTVPTSVESITVSLIGTSHHEMHGATPHKPLQPVTVAGHRLPRSDSEGISVSGQHPPNDEHR